MQSLVLLVLVLGAVGADETENRHSMIDGLMEKTFDVQTPSEMVKVFRDYKIGDLIKPLQGMTDSDISIITRITKPWGIVTYVQDLNQADRKTLLSLDLPTKNGTVRSDEEELQESKKTLKVLRGLATKDRTIILAAFDLTEFLRVLTVGGAQVSKGDLLGIFKGLLTVFGEDNKQARQGLVFRQIIEMRVRKPRA
ncbi:uncharacterized protein LOC124111646 isoform X1 [Haliotis rufescens]|uniref:uncharacterized protein LOC124111646 isoform X1 n=1 Tax=Haliotis rufescens TaxID=6454 RepID=UPI00201F73C2|nr:uncharacterized protein LOC124111646 isoform X1 [Haliotis rufescens]